MSYPGLATATDDRTTKASPADVRRKTVSLFSPCCFLPNSIHAPNLAAAPD